LPRKRGRRKKRSVKSDDVTIYTDGSANGKGGSGSIFLRYNGDEFYCYGVVAHPTVTKVTNNQAELTAIILGLSEATNGDAPRSITVVSDSEYSVGVLFKRWKAKKNRELVTLGRIIINHLRSKGVIVKGRNVPRTEKHIKLCDKYANVWRKKDNKRHFIKYVEN